LPIVLFETVELSSEDPISDVQLSSHLDRFVYIVLLHKIVHFHIDSQTLVPMVNAGQTPAQDRQLIQSRTIINCSWAFTKVAHSPFLWTAVLWVSADQTPA
jgi:hypothetical protein